MHLEGILNLCIVKQSEDTTLDGIHARFRSGLQKKNKEGNMKNTD